MGKFLAKWLECQWLSMPKSQQSWVRSQHSQTQWNLRAADEAVYVKRKNLPKSPFKISFIAVPGLLIR
jgi:hypothetical protein